MYKRTFFGSLTPKTYKFIKNRNREKRSITLPYSIEYKRKENKLCTNINY